MYGERKKPWDIVPGFDNERRSRSFSHLTSLAGSVVREVLGPSPQEAERLAEMERYNQACRDWREFQDRLETQVKDGIMPAEYLNPYPEQPKSELPDDPASLDRWLRQTITARLLHKLDAVMLDLIGIETGYGQWRLKSGGSTLGKRFSEKAQAMAVEIADKWLDDNANKPATEMKLDDVSRHYRYELEAATKKAIEARIAVIAKERADHIRLEVLEAAVDRAMFEAYPILRRMDAAERLGAKTETEAAE
jgi:hypothetical protein